MYFFLSFCFYCLKKQNKYIFVDFFLIRICFDFSIKIWIYAFQDFGTNQTYIIGHYNPSVRITSWLLTSPMLRALILYISSGTYSWKSTKNDRFLRSFSWQFYLLSVPLLEICWEEVAKEIFSYFTFWCLTWDLNTGLTSNEPTYYQLGYVTFYMKLEYHFMKIQLMQYFWQLI